MHLKIQHIVIFITIIFISCVHEPSKLSAIKGQQLSIENTLVFDPEIESYIKPYQIRVNEVLDSVLAYAPIPISKTDGKFNSSAGNLLADIILSEANPIYFQRTGENLDFAIANYGGIRSVISAGNITARTAYEVMPFENTIVVVDLKGDEIVQLIHFLIKSRNPHPISGLKITIDASRKLKDFKIKGLAFDKNKTYHVATVDYLVNGGSDIGFYDDLLERTDLNYYLRNAIIDYFKKVDTLTSSVDDRFVKLPN